VSKMIFAPARLLRDFVRHMRTTEFGLLTASLSFSTVLALVPLLAVCLSVFHWHGGLQKLLDKFEPYVLENLAQGAGQQVSRSIRGALERIHSGALGMGGGLALLFISTKLFHDIEEAVQRIFLTKTQRPWVVRLSLYWLVMFLGPLLVAFIVGMNRSKEAGFWRSLSLQHITFGFVLLSLAAIYKFVPTIRLRWLAVLPSAVLASSLMAVTQVFFRALSKEMLTLNKIYGGLAAIPLFLIWIQLLWYVFLAGAGLTYVLQQRLDRRRAVEP
jgi:membrane protein